MKPQFSASALALALGFFATSASADAQVCMTADEMQAALIDWYGETPVDTPNERDEQIWASERTGTWTMVRYQSDGNACVLAQGDDWMKTPSDKELLAGLER